MPQEYYPYAFRHAGLDQYLLWYSNDLDGVHLGSEGYVPTFDSIDHLSSYASIHDLAPLIMGDPILHDLDSVERSARNSSSLHIDCNETLGAWNLFGDFARSVGPSASLFLDRVRAADRLYDKVFFGCNLPAITPEGQEYLPTWAPGEIESIQHLLSVGLSLFRSATTPPQKEI